MPHRTLGLTVLICVVAFGGAWLGDNVIGSDVVAVAFGLVIMAIAVWVLGSYGWTEYFMFAMTLALALLLTFGVVWLVTRPFS
jgi:hypothetical protein